jgi:hypothetical protein
MRREVAKLPQARRYLRAATWGFDNLIEGKLSGRAFIFYTIGLFAALRAVQHMLLNHDRRLSPDHEKVVSAWARATKDDSAIPELRFIRRSRDLLLKEGSFAAYSTVSEGGIGEGDNYRSTHNDYDLAYYDDDGNRHDLAAEIRAALEWCDRELTKIEAELPVRYEEDNPEEDEWSFVQCGTQ